MNKEEFVEEHIRHCQTGKNSKNRKNSMSKRQCARNLYDYIMRWNYPLTIKSHRDLPKH